MDRLTGFRLLAGLCLTLLLSACGPQDTLVDVRGKPAPTAMFVFFDKDSSLPQEESNVVIQEAAAYLTQYNNTVARIVGHVAPDEPVASDANQRLDRLRASAIGADLMKLGVKPERIQPVVAGRTENMSNRSGDPGIDRRVDILFGVQ